MKLKYAPGTEKYGLLSLNRYGNELDHDVHETSNQAILILSTTIALLKQNPIRQTAKNRVL